MPDASVHCCVTSPPYWGLRDYGTGRWKGGDPTCKHRVGQVADTKAPGAIVTGQRPGVDASRCRECGARRVDEQIGLEPTPAAYVEKMVAVFREVRRVLRDDGTLWLNIGDCYAGVGAQWGGTKSIQAGAAGAMMGRGTFRKPTGGLKSKDLVGIPWRVAFALQADGWYLRSDIIWAKPNPMPESVTDRPTKAHEYVFLLSKKQSYYYDAEAVAEAATCAGKTVRYTEASKNARSKSDPRFATRPATDMVVKKTRNRRTVWTITPKPFKGAHFAVMPTELARLCVIAGTPRGGLVLDPFCGAGTTGCAAMPEGRRFYGIDLNPTYVREVAAPRLRGVVAEITGPSSPPPPSRKKP